MLHFQELKNKVKLLLENYTSDLSKLYILRDVFGRITLYTLDETNVEKLEKLFYDEIGKEWFVGVKIIKENDMSHRELVNSTTEILSGIFYGERNLVKRSWSESQHVKNDLNTKVVTFYSYKGGLGRTTTLMLTALQLTRSGKKVVVIDFDLEAPGVATLLKPENNEYYPKYGTVDYLLDAPKYTAENSRVDIDEYIYPINSKELTGLSGGELFVMQATNHKDMDVEEYYQKISRIDFNMPQYSNKGNSIETLLSSIDDRYKPDFILLDSRAGIHDIGGVTLTKYSDEAVCIFYGNEQNTFGMKFILPIIVSNEIPFYLINSPVPVSEEEAEEEREMYLQSSFDILCGCGYFKDNIPYLYDESSEHFPLDIKYNVEATLINSTNRIVNLLENDGANNVYLKLADKLSTPDFSKEQSVIGKLDRTNVLRDISNITPGDTPSSENEFFNEDDLRKKFYPLKDYKYIFDNNKFLVIGPKGSGKTALYSVLKYPKYARALAKYVEATSNEIEKTTWIVGLGKELDDPSSDNFETIGEFNDARFYRKYWQCLLVKTFKNHINNLNLTIEPAINEIFTSKYSGYAEIINKYPNISEIIMDLLYELDERFNSDGRLVIVTYDYLDFAIPKKYRGDVIAALISFWFENISKLRKIKCKIFLREDIFKYEVKDGITDKAKLNNFTANIGWTYEYLLAMVWKRIFENSPEFADLIKVKLVEEGYSLPYADNEIGYVPLPNTIVNKIVLKELIGEKMGKGNKAYTYNWIAYRLADTNDKIKPRSIIKLFALAANNEIEENINNDVFEKPLIRPKSLETSIQSVSEDTLRDLSEEYSEFEDIFNKLKNYCTQFPIEFENLKIALTNSGIVENNVVSVIEQLKSIGVLKEYVRKKSDPIRYHIPDIYLKGMGLSRKGYK